MGAPGDGRCGFALPLLFRLYIGSERGGRLGAPARATTGARLLAAQAAHPPAHRQLTKLELAREMLALVVAQAGQTRARAAGPGRDLAALAALAGDALRPAVEPQVFALTALWYAERARTGAAAD